MSHGMPRHQQRIAVLDHFSTLKHRRQVWKVVYGDLQGEGTSVATYHFNGGIEGFPGYTKNWLYPCRSVPRQHVQPDLAEACYRCDHRNEDLKPLLLEFLKHAPIDGLKPVLDRNSRQLPRSTAS